jgi:hypothetical protein
MKEPGLDGRHRDQNGRISQKHGNTQNQNLSQPVDGFAPTTTVEQMRQRTGQTSLKDIRDAKKPK